MPPYPPRKLASLALKKIPPILPVEMSTSKLIDSPGLPFLVVKPTKMAKTRLHLVLGN